MKSEKSALPTPDNVSNPAVTTQAPAVADEVPVAAEEVVEEEEIEFTEELVGEEISMMADDTRTSADVDDDITGYDDEDMEESEDVDEVAQSVEDDEDDMGQGLIDPGKLEEFRSYR